MPVSENWDSEPEMTSGSKVSRLNAGDDDDFGGGGFGQPAKARSAAARPTSSVRPATT